MFSQNVTLDIENPENAYKMDIKNGALERMNISNIIYQSMSNILHFCSSNIHALTSN